MNKNKAKRRHIIKADKILTPKEVYKLFDKMEKQELKIGEYRDNCQYFKNKECSGEQGFYSKHIGAGCKVCMKKHERNKNNALPPLNTQEEYDNYSREIYNVEKNLHKNCNLAFDKKYCRYKNSFKFCLYCNRKFLRER